MIGVGILGSVMSSKMASGMMKEFSEEAEKLASLANPEILLDQPSKAYQQIYYYLLMIRLTLSDQSSVMH